MPQIAELSIAQVVDTGAVTAVYQPIVELASGRVVAYEALARGPRGTYLESPDHLFAAAAEAGLATALDWVCRAAALQGALEAGLGRSTKLFVNVEPASLRAPRPAQFETLIELATSALSIVVEVTERSLVDDPAALIAALSRARDAGMGVAIDDLGADLASLALLPFVEPDVIKLDMSLVQQHADSEIASIAGAVRADAREPTPQGAQRPEARNPTCACRKGGLARPTGALVSQRHRAPSARRRGTPRALVGREGLPDRPVHS